MESSSVWESTVKKDIEKILDTQIKIKVVSEWKRRGKQLYLK